MTHAILGLAAVLLVACDDDAETSRADEGRPDAAPSDASRADAAVADAASRDGGPPSIDAAADAGALPDSAADAALLPDTGAPAACAASCARLVDCAVESPLCPAEDALADACAAVCAERPLFVALESSFASCPGRLASLLALDDRLATACGEAPDSDGRCAAACARAADCAEEGCAPLTAAAVGARCRDACVATPGLASVLDVRARCAEVVEAMAAADPVVGAWCGQPPEPSPECALACGRYADCGAFNCAGLDEDSREPLRGLCAGACAADPGLAPLLNVQARCPQVLTAAADYAPLLAPLCDEGGRCGRACEQVAGCAAECAALDEADAPWAEALCGARCAAAPGFAALAGDRCDDVARFNAVEPAHARACPAPSACAEGCARFASCASEGETRCPVDLDPALLAAACESVCEEELPQACPELVQAVRAADLAFADLCPTSPPGDGTACGDACARMAGCADEARCGAAVEADAVRAGCLEACADDPVLGQAALALPRCAELLEVGRERQPGLVEVCPGDRPPPPPDRCEILCGAVSVCVADPEEGACPALDAEDRPALEAACLEGCAELPRVDDDALPDDCAGRVQLFEAVSVEFEALCTARDVDPGPLDCEGACDRIIACGFDADRGLCARNQPEEVADYRVTCLRVCGDAMLLPQLVDSYESCAELVAGMALFDQPFVAACGLDR